MDELSGRLRLVLDAASFLGPMQRASDAASLLGTELARMDATWEPHDWRDFD